MMGSLLPVIATPQGNHVSVLATESNEQKECGCGSHDLFTGQPQAMYQIALDETMTQSPKPTPASELPPSFSWTDKNGTNWITPAQDQGSCGSCWDFAALGALESIIQIREGCAGLHLDLSEQYVLSCLPYAGSCNGGWAYSAYRWIKSNASAGNYCNGIIPEDCFPYEVTDEVPCANVSPDWEEFLIPISTYGRWIPDGSIADRNVMKTQIMETGPIVATMLFTIYLHGPDNLEEWGYTHTDPQDYYPYPGPLQGSNHQVVIVGWKDDVSITNGGYWIVKNSLSEEWGYNGFFNIEYGSLNIDSKDVNWVEYHAFNFSNWKPVAVITGPTEGQTNQELVFDGSNSIDHEGSIVAYDWELGDGTTAAGATVTHTYTQPGIYRVSLTVTDNASYTDTQTIWVYIDTQNHPPRTPWILGRRHGSNGTTYRYTFWATDPDGDPVEYYLNWGDDYWFGGSAGWIGPFASGETVTLEKTYEEPGNYTIRIKAQDCYGAKSEWRTLPVTMPTSSNLPTLWFGEEFFKKFPHAFLLLRHLIGTTN